MDNVICTPHLGYVTLDEWELAFRSVFRQVNAFAEGNADQRRQPRCRGALRAETNEYGRRA